MSCVFENDFVYSWLWEKKVKLCKKCNTEKEVSCFNLDKRSKSDGLQTSCKECQKVYYFANRERMIEIKKQNKYKSKQREYFLNNKDEINKYKRLRYSTIEGGAKVKALNRERRDSFRTKSDGSVTSDFLIFLLNKQENKCAISGKSLVDGYHIDHIIPISKGGEHVSSNIQLLHPVVNLKKGNKLNYEYIE